MRGKISKTVFWRKLFYTRPPCDICIRPHEEAWGHVCCWDCRDLSKCYRVWIRRGTAFCRKRPLIRDRDGEKDRNKYCSTLISWIKENDINL